MKHFLVLFSLLAFVTPAYAQGVCGFAYKQENYKKAVSVCLPLAEKGNKTAQGIVGTLYYYGHGVSQNKKKAWSWWELGAAQLDSRSMTNRGIMIRQQRPDAYKAAVELFRLAAEQGYAPAQANLAYMYEEGLGIPKNDKMAVKWYKLAAKQGDEDAQENLGLYYEFGIVVSQNYKTAVKLYRFAAEKGSKSAESKLKKLKSTLRSKFLKKCEFDNISKVKNDRQYLIVNRFCRSKMDDKSLEWLINHNK